MHIYTWALWMHAVRCDLHGSAAPLHLSYGAALRPAAVNEVLNSEEAGSRSSLLLMLETSRMHPHWPMRHNAVTRISDRL